MAKGIWWQKFEWGAWLADPALGKCSMQTHGIWINLLCVMMEAEQAQLTGTIQELCRLIGCFPEEMESGLAELERTNAADVIFCNGIVTIMSRRLAKELNAKENNRLRVTKARKKEQCNADVMPVSRDRVRDKSKSKNKKENESKQESNLSGNAQQVAPTRGGRLPDKFLLTEPMRSWARERNPSIDVELETEKFCNYYRSKSGNSAIRLDWQATWRNWILNAEAFNGRGIHQNTVGAKKGSAEKLAEYAEIFDKYEAEE
jgi:hypothetical protein